MITRDPSSRREDTLTDREIRRISSIAKALSDETRIIILRLLDRRGPLFVGQIVDEFDLAQPTISRHLSVLRAAGLVSAKRHAQHMIYTIGDLAAAVRAILQLPPDPVGAALSRAQESAR